MSVRRTKRLCERWRSCADRAQLGVRVCKGGLLGEQPVAIAIEWCGHYVESSCDRPEDR